MQLFYTPDIQSGATSYTLDEEESKHCIKVLRMQAGEQVKLIDGRGSFYSADISDPHPKRTVLRILNVEPDYQKRNHYLHIAVAPTKNIERLEWFLEKATEIGIDEITPIICQRSERKELRTDRLNKVITAAIKQSLKAFHPLLNEPVPLQALLSSGFNGGKFIAHCDEGEKRSLKEFIVPQSNYLVLIGPEGDFTPAEVEFALQHGFNAITLGESRLRTETAALEACFEINFLNRI